jgi:hypothetical protein
MRRANSDSWWTPAPSAASFCTVRKRSRPALSSAFRRRRESHSRLGERPPPPNVRAAYFFCHLLLAAVYRPILGLDFLSAHGLLVNPVGRQVLDSKSLKLFSKPTTAAGTLRSKFAAALCSIAPLVRSLLFSFPAIVGDGKGKPWLKHRISRRRPPCVRQGPLPGPGQAAPGRS